MKKGEIVDMSELVGECGCFCADTDVNNGYGCLHPRAYERGGVEPGVGVCYAWACPLGHEFVRGLGCEQGDVADVEDLKRLGLNPDDECWREEGRWVIIVYGSLEASMAPDSSNLHP